MSSVWAGSCCISSGWLMNNTGCLPDDLWCWPMSSGWDNYIDPYVIRMTSLSAVSHLDDLWSMHYVIRMTYLALVCHPDGLRQMHYVIRMTYSSIFCLPDDLTEVWNLIRMSYGNVIMSSRWDTLPFSSHPDEIANFDFPQHAVTLQRFRNYLPIRGVNSCK